MKDALDIAFSAPQMGKYSPPPQLIKWIPFIRVAKSQYYSAARIAESLRSQGIRASPGDIQAIIDRYHRCRNAAPIVDLLNAAAADIGACRAGGMSEHQVCFWLAINRGIVIHQPQLNAWRRSRGK